MDIQRTVFQVVILGGIIYYAVCSFFDTPCEAVNENNHGNIGQYSDPKIGNAPLNLVGH